MCAVLRPSPRTGWSSLEYLFSGLFLFDCICKRGIGCCHRVSELVRTQEESLSQLPNTGCLKSRRSNSLFRSGIEPAKRGYGAWKRAIKQDNRLAFERSIPAAGWLRQVWALPAGSRLADMQLTDRVDTHQRTVSRRVCFTVIKSLCVQALPQSSSRWPVILSWAAVSRS